MAYRSLVACAALALLTPATAALARGGGGYRVVMQPGLSLTPRKDNICVAETAKLATPRRTRTATC